MGTLRALTKRSCQDVSLEGTTVFEDAIMDITLERTTDYMLCDQEFDILDDTPYLVRVQKDQMLSISFVVVGGETKH